MSMMSAPLDGNMNLDFKTTIAGPEQPTLFDSAYGNNQIDDLVYRDMNGTSSWNYWQNYYYPHVIKESYPIYIQEQAQDKGKKAFEIIKILKDKQIIKLNKVEDFVEAMDELIKIL